MKIVPCIAGAIFRFMYGSSLAAFGDWFSIELRPRRTGLTFFLDKKSKQKNQDRFELA